MSEQTVSAPGPTRRHPDARSQPGERRAKALRMVYAHRWALGAAALLAVATLVVVWARARPGYDPYGWLVWGRLTIHGKLDTNGAPSWKPLPYLFTLPYALLGRQALWLWMITSVAVSLSGVIFAWRVAFTLVGAPAERRYAAYAAGLVAGGAVLGIDQYLHSILSAESDTMIVACCLAAVDCMLCRRYRWAFWAWWLAALGRPEVWAPMGIYLVWAWREIPAMRRQIVLGTLALPLLWFGIPAISSKSPFSAASLAQNSPRMLHGNKVTGTFGRFLALDAASIKIAAALAAAMAVARRDRAVLLLAGGALLWVVVEIAFALHGWPAVPRYLFEAAAGVCVLAGVFIGRVVLDARELLARARAPSSPRVAGWVSVAVIAVFAVSLVPAARSRISVERKDLKTQRARTAEINRLGSVVARLGAARILACGHPDAPIEFQAMLAWYLGTNTGILYFDPRHEALHPHPVVKLYPHSYGWQVFPAGTTTAAQTARCRGLSLRT